MRAPRVSEESRSCLMRLREFCLVILDAETRRTRGAAENTGPIAHDGDVTDDRINSNLVRFNDEIVRKVYHL